MAQRNGNQNHSTPAIEPAVRRLAQIVHAELDGRPVLFVQVDAGGRPIGVRDGDGTIRIGMATVPLDQVRASIALMDPQPPIILTLTEAAHIGRMAPATLKRRVNEGGFKNAVKRRTPLLFFRDSFIRELMRDR